MEPSDLDLWQAAAGGDHGAFRVLVERHTPQLFRVALSLSGKRSDAEDICQDTFVAAFRALKSFRGQASVKTWLTSILMRRSATHWKRQRHNRKTVSLEAEYQPAGPDNDGEGKTLRSRLGVASTTQTVDQRLDVMEVIRGLPEDYREVLILREVQQMSYQEIAQALKMPCGTVESRLYRARAELRRRLSGY